VHVSSDSELRFSVWRIAGRKQLTLRGQALVLEAGHLVHRLRACLDRALHDGQSIEVSIVLNEQLRARLALYEEQAALLRGARPPARPRGISRAGALHLRALQALDGREAGASHREIAEVLFGEDAVRERWSADGELRAQVRYLLTRAHGFLNGGYLALAGIRKAASTEMSKRGESLPPGFASVS
jgi:hypothetical protein